VPCEDAPTTKATTISNIPSTTVSYNNNNNTDPKPNEDNSQAHNMVDLLEEIEAATQTCPFGDTGLHIRLLTPKSIREIATLHNVDQWLGGPPETVIIRGKSRRRHGFPDYLCSYMGRTLLIGTVLAGGDKAWLRGIVYGMTRLRDGDQPFRHSFAGNNDPGLAAFIEKEPVLCVQHIRKADFFDAPELFYRSSLPFSKVVQRDDLKMHESADAAYEIEFNHDVVNDGFDKRPYLLTEFPGIPENWICARAVAGLVCDEKCFLISEMDPGRVQVVEGTVQWVTVDEAQEELRKRRLAMA
jgi:hypothetical protein